MNGCMDDHDRMQAYRGGKRRYTEVYNVVKKCGVVEWMINILEREKMICSMVQQQSVSFMNGILLLPLLLGGCCCW